MFDQADVISLSSTEDIFETYPDLERPVGKGCFRNSHCTDIAAKEITKNHPSTPTKKRAGKQDLNNTRKSSRFDKLSLKKTRPTKNGTDKENKSFTQKNILSYFQQRIIPLDVSSSPSNTIAVNNNNINNNFNDTIMIDKNVDNRVVVIEGQAPINCEDNHLDLLTSMPQNMNKVPVLRDKELLSKSLKRSRKTPPTYKTIEGTTFAVDAFSFGEIAGISHYFLTHFHADHYTGLGKKFCKPLYLSEITKRLVQHLIKVDVQYLNVLQLGIPTTINDVEIVALDANHCPGAVMLLFKLKNGPCILHTGDFRANQFMESWPEFWNNEIDLIYLDTTYLTAKYEFYTQQDAINEAIYQSGRFIAQNSQKNYLIVCGSYTIGKENIWLSIAQAYNLKVWMEPIKRKAVDCLFNREIAKILVDRPEDARIHVLYLGKITYNKLSEYLHNFENSVNQFNEQTFECMLAIRPTGWETRKFHPKTFGRITLIGIQYSEHSSYKELQRFVEFLQPKRVISTVPHTRNIYDVKGVPSEWLQRVLKPKRESFQPSLDEFFSNRLTSSMNSNKSVSSVSSITSGGLFLDPDYMS